MRNARIPWLVNHSALSYANQWFVTDREFMRKLQLHDSNEIDAKQLGKLAAKYMVARSFKKDGSDGAVDRRWTTAAAHLKQAWHGTRPINDEVHALAGRLGKVAPKTGTTEQKLISAATKFLWFAGKHNVRILDKRAVVALSQLTSLRGLGTDYSTYATAWQEQFSAHQRELEKAVSKLPAQLAWTRIDPKFHAEAKAVFQEAWFTDRVFDKYLWTIGATEGSATSFA